MIHIPIVYYTTKAAIHPLGKKNFGLHNKVETYFSVSVFITTNVVTHFFLFHLIGFGDGTFYK